MTASLEPGASPVSLDEARDWLRMGAGIDDDVVAALLRAATGLCEAFIGQWLIVRAADETVALRGGTARLCARPVVGIDDVWLVGADGAETAVGAGGYRLRPAHDGASELFVTAPSAARRIRVAYRAGIAESGDGVPDAIRQGILRMTQHLHEARGGAGETPSAIIAALWQPWRRVTLGGGL